MILFFLSRVADEKTLDLTLSKDFCFLQRPNIFFIHSKASIVSPLSEIKDQKLYRILLLYRWLFEITPLGESTLYSKPWFPYSSAPPESAHYWETHFCNPLLSSGSFMNLFKLTIINHTSCTPTFQYEYFNNLSQYSEEQRTAHCRINFGRCYSCLYPESFNVQVYNKKITLHPVFQSMYDWK